MSRRIKPDRRNVVDRGTIIEITNVVEYPDVPEELVTTMVRARNWLWRIRNRLEDEMYQYEGNREGMAIDCFYEGEHIDYMLKELRLIPEDRMD